MAKSDISAEQAQALIDRVSQELGLIRSETAGFWKVSGPASKFTLYIQKSKMLGRIDSQLPTSDAEGKPYPGLKQLSAPNGSITSHVEPTLEHLEFHLRRLADAAVGVHVINRPRPFAANKGPARRPKPTAMEVPEAALIEFDSEGSKRLELKERLIVLHQRVRDVRINRYVEENGLDRDVAAQVADRKVTLEDAMGAVDNARTTELSETLAEAGIEIDS